MLDEIRAGNVATVIIKDQSRIGRDVVEAGLLKRTFDEYHVRFTAVNGNLNTANGFERRDKGVVRCRHQPQNQSCF